MIPSRFSSNHPSITPMSSVFIYIYRYSASCLLTDSSIRSHLHGLTATCSFLRVSKEKRYFIFSGSIPSNRRPKFWIHSSLHRMTAPLAAQLTGLYSSSKFTSYQGFMAHAKGSGLEAVPKETEQNFEGLIMTSELSNCYFRFNPESRNAKSICFSSLDSSTDLATENCVGQKAWIALPGHKNVERWLCPHLYILLNSLQVYESCNMSQSKKHVQQSKSLFCSPKALSLHSSFNNVSIQRAKGNNWTKIMAGWGPRKTKAN